MKAPGTLSDAEQVSFNAQVLSLVRGFYGEQAQFALAVLKFVANEGMTGLALYTSGSTDDQKQLQAAFVLAGETLASAETRKLAVDEGEPDRAKN